MTVYATGILADIVLITRRDGSSDRNVFDRVRGSSAPANTSVKTNLTSSEGAYVPVGFDYNTSIDIGSTGTSGNYLAYAFRRARGFCDVVAYWGCQNPAWINHNLGVAPELMFVKKRYGGSSGYNHPFQVYASPLGATDYLVLNSTNARATSSSKWGNTTPNSSSFLVGSDMSVNSAAFSSAYIAYLFATCPGASKVGSYTGSGTTKQIDCGFSSGARFVMIKRADSTGNWYIYDSARGIVAGNDPYLFLNDQSTEVTSTDYIDTYSAGFEISSTAPAEINASGGTFIYLAIA